MYITDRNNLRHRQPTRPDHRLQRQSGQGRHRDRAGQVHLDCSGHRSDAKLAGYHYGGGPGRYRLRLGRGCECGQEGDVHGRTHSGGYLLKPDRIAIEQGGLGFSDGWHVHRSGPGRGCAHACQREAVTAHGFSLLNFHFGYGKINCLV
jgi:hypothetical protein